MCHSAKAGIHSAKNTDAEIKKRMCNDAKCLRVSQEWLHGCCRPADTYFL